MEDSTPLLDEDTQDFIAFLTILSDSLDDTLDLEEQIDQFADINDLDENVLKHTLIEIAAGATGGQGNDRDIRRFLKALSQKPTTTTRHPNSSGMTPFATEKAVKDFLRSLPVSVQADPYHNTGFDAVRYKQFDRTKNQYGHDNVEFNNQKPSRPLANPTLNVNTGRTDEARAFEAIDAVGFGSKVSWRVVNRLTNEYVTRYIHVEDAKQIAAELNNDFQRALDEAGDGSGPQSDGSVNPPGSSKPKKLKALGGGKASKTEETDLDEGVSRKHFEQVANTVRAIEDPQKRQHFADHHAGIFAK